MESWERHRNTDPQDCGIGWRWFLQMPPTTGHMDAEEQTGLLVTTPEYLEAVKVFPLIPHILRDAMVRVISSFKLTEMVLNASSRSL